MDFAKYLILLVTVAQLLPSSAGGARILGLFGYSTQSHNNVFTALTKELAVRGHDLTVVTPYPLKNAPGKYRQIEIADLRNSVEQTSNITNMNVLQRFIFITSLFLNACPRVLQHPELKTLLKEKFDLILISVVFNDCLLPFAFRMNASFITIGPQGLLAAYKIGNPEPSSFVPSRLFSYSDHMNFWERSMNFLIPSILMLCREFIVMPKMNQAARQFFGNDIPAIEDLECNASLAFINTHLGFNYPRPLNPNIIEVGGMHIKKKPDPLPKDLQEYLDGAEEGAIYFSMGSMLRADDLPPEKVQEILQAFAGLKQRVVWKWSSDELPGQPSNVKIGKWFPQQSILAHPNIRLFITHGGLLSTQESIFHGVPIVGIPIFTDQHLNMRRSENLGYALTVNVATITTDSFLKTMQTVLNNASFSEMAQRLKNRFRDELNDPLERAVFWTEYVLRHEGAHHLRSAATRLYWFQYYMLDFAAFMLGLAVLPVLAIRAGLFRKFLAIFYSVSPSPSKTRKQSKNDKLDSKNKQGKKLKIS
ncbi:UDP-glycosyltransferase-19 [Ephemera danica]|nr:UDP-glycosyltransferase-19 [Ephemera danica]